MRTTPDMGPLLAPLEDTIRLQFIPTLNGYASCSSILRDLFALSCHLGRMGIVNHMDIGDSKFDASVKVTAPIKDLIMHRSLTAFHQMSVLSKLIFVTTIALPTRLKPKRFMPAYPCLFRGPWI